MSNSNINWLGNKVLDPGTPRPSIASTVIRASLPEDQDSAQNSHSTQETISIQEIKSATPIGPILPDIPDLPPSQQGPPPATEMGYIPYYLTQNIGRNVRAEFIINNSNIDKTGKLIEVGINYFVLEDVNSRTHIMCDLYSVKFVTVLQL